MSSIQPSQAFVECLNEQNQVKTGQTLSQIYAAIASKILAYLGPRDLCRAYLVCRKWKQIIFDDEELLKLTVKFYPNPLATMAYFYSTAKTPIQKRASLCYLLYYQHYNAEFTEEENRRLNYPFPLFASQKKSGYIRTDYARLFELIKPWIELHLSPFFKLSFSSANPLNLVKLSAHSAISILKIFFKDQIREIESLRKASTKEKGFIFIAINPSDLKKNAYKIVQEKLANAHFPINKIQKMHPNLRFIFLLQIPDIDCCLMWGAGWRSSSSLQCFKLDSEEIFEKKINVFSLLNQAGAVPDRLALNAFLTEGLENRDFAGALKILGPPTSLEQESNPIYLFNTLAAWQRQMKKIRRDVITGDAGSELYRTAVLQWHACFFEAYNLTQFAAPLLYSQVIPWILNATGRNQIVQWAKAYQNLCEIVMFCLQAFPEKFIDLDLESILLHALQHRSPLFSNIQIFVGLFPYGMASFLHILEHFLRHFGEQQFKITCVCHSYFETINLVKMLKEKHLLVTIQTDGQLEDIREVPDVLIADIHPNNAAKKILFQNNVAGWVQKTLKANPSKTMFLVLDITLNHLSDSILQKTFEKLVPFIEEGRLEIFGMQSLAKLVQVGADNFSGGICVYLGNPLKEMNIHFPAPLPEKSKFFSLMNFHFPIITNTYFGLVRKNTDWMYQFLAKAFLNISDLVFLKTLNEERPFCAASITLNGDNNTVYIAINFTPLLEELQITNEKQKESLIISIRDLIIGLADSRGLPLTGRQSFGFSLSNMSHAAEAIRFSLGIERRELMLGYADAITDVIYALSIYVARDSQAFTLEEFKDKFNEVKKILTCGEMVIPLAASLCEETSDDTIKTVGDAAIYFKDHQLRLEISKKNGKTKNILQPNIAIAGYISSDSYSLIVKLLFHAAFNTAPIYLTVQKFKGKPQYIIHGIFGGRFAFLEDRQVEDNNIKIIFAPEFSLALSNQMCLASHQVFVSIEELQMGSIPVQISKLDAGKRYLIFKKCVRYHFEVIPYKNELNSFLLYFTQPKASCDYSKSIKDCYQKGRLSAVVAFINSLDTENLPLASDFSWKFEERPFEALHQVLRWLGTHLSLRLTEGHVLEIIKIRSDDCKQAILDGIFEGLISASMKDTKSLPIEAARVFASLFNRQDLSIKGNRYKINGYEFDRWIKDFESYIRANPMDIPRARHYLVAFFPLMKTTSLHDTTYSIALRSISQLTEFKPLVNHIAALEKRALEKAKDVKMAHSLTNYLKIYVDYSLSEADKQTLLARIRNLPQDLRRAWVYMPEFYYSPLDAFEIDYVPIDENLIFTAGDQEAIHKFFDQGIDGISILKERLATKKKIDITVVLRWAIITQSHELFSLALQICQGHTIYSPAMESLQFYRPYLNVLDPTQNELIKLLKASKKIVKVYDLIRRGHQAADDQKWKKALKLFSKAYALSSLKDRSILYSYPKFYAEKCINMVVAAGHIANKLGKFDVAEDFFSTALDWDPANPLAIRGLATTYFKQKRYQEAEEMASQFGQSLFSL